MCCPSIWVPVKEHAQVVGGGLYTYGLHTFCLYIKLQ